jgi:hypothetical protein
MVVTLHFIILSIGFLGLVLIFFEHFRSFFVMFYLIVIGSNIIFLTRCPLSILEDRLGSKIGFERCGDNFINRVLKKIFNVTLPEKIIQLVMGSYFIISVYLFIKMKFL